MKKCIISLKPTATIYKVLVNMHYFGNNSIKRNVPLRKLLTCLVSNFLTTPNNILICLFFASITFMLSRFFVDNERHLTCNDLSSVKLGPLIGVGAVKAVYIATWRNKTYALSTLNNKEYLNDFKLGLNMLKLYQYFPLFVKLKGSCPKYDIILTEYHENGNVYDFFKNSNMILEPKLRIQFCIDYAKILKSLHTFNHVFCDSNDLKKLLSQLLITKDLHIILNDVDALADASNGPIFCGLKPLFGEFIAPEQRHPTDGYDYKSDLWKFPFVCEYFLGETKFSDHVNDLIFDIHSRCRNTVPKRRPSAEELVHFYEEIFTLVN